MTEPTADSTEAAGTDPTQPPQPKKRPWYKRKKLVIPLVILVVLSIGGVAFYFVAWRHRGAEEASVSEAVEKFRDEGQGGQADFLSPAPGVYTYEGTGTEKLSVLGTSQQWGPRLPSTVTRGDDSCWTWRIDYSTNHYQEVHYCPEGRVLQEVSGITYQSFDFVAFSVGDLNEFTCEPRADTIRVDAEPGDTWDQSCDGKSKDRGTRVTSAGTNEFVGIEDVKVGDDEVPAYRYKSERELTGDQTGTEKTESWYAVRDGLLLKTTRNLRVASPAPPPLGDVIYTEEGTYTLSSLTPQR